MAGPAIFLVLLGYLLTRGRAEELVSWNEVTVHLAIVAITLMVAFRLDWHPLVFFAVVLLQCARLIHLVWGLDIRINRR